MKYGILYNKNNQNIGDDIQAYATARFLPQIDYFVDREHIDEFHSQQGEPVAVIMNAWYMWAKWNWPPSKDIYPHMIGFHYADHQIADQTGTPIKFEFLNGIGGDYLKAYSPIGCRDYFTRDRLQELGIDSYFSGCITLTLPKQKETAEKGKYVCLVDLEQRATEKMLRILEEKGIPAKVITHDRERDPDMSWEDRVKIVEDYLTLYQNARCVVTRRLHCALPCLAMEVPLFVVKERRDDIRFSPYYDYFHYSTVTDFMNDDYDYDFEHPAPNKTDYRKTREWLINSCETFIEETKQVTGTTDELFQPEYTEAEVRSWRHDVMKSCMDEWFVCHRDLQIAHRKIKGRVRNLRAKVAQREETIAALKLSKQEEIKALKISKQEEIKALKQSKKEEITSLRQAKDHEIDELKKDRDEKIRLLQEEIDRYKNRTFGEKLKSLFQKET